MNVRSNRSIEGQLTERIRELEIEKDRLERTLNELQQQLIHLWLPVIALNDDSEILFVNEAACRFFDMNDGTLIGKSLFEFIPDCSGFLRQKTCDDTPIITDIILKDGTNKTIELQRIGRKERGSIYAIREAELKKEREKETGLTPVVLSTIFQHFPDSLLLLDKNGRIIYSNSIFCDTFLIPRDYCYGKSLRTFFPQDKQDEYDCLLQSIKNNGRPFSGTLSLQHGNLLKIFDASIYYLDFERNYVMILRDRTELMNMYNLMYLTLHRMYTTFDNMFDGMILWSKDQPSDQFISCFERIFQQKIIYETNDLKILFINRVGKEILSLDTDGNYTEQFEQVMIQDKNEEYPLPIYLQHLSKRCGPYTVHLHTPDHRTLGIELYHLPNIVESLNLTVIRDITERLAMEDNLRKSEMLHVLGELAAGVAHEIRNPMTSLKGFIQLLEASVDGYTMYFKIILSELERIESIVNEFLVLAKPQAIKYQYYNVIKIMKDTIDLLSAQAALENVRIHTFFPKIPLNIFCEPNQIKQVFINIVKNAIEVMSGGGNITIQISKEQDTSFVRVSIRDEGEGIPKEQLKKLGQPFYTSKERGTGLGLMVSYKIVKEHGGRIVVNSKVGRGTVFHIYLPMKEISKYE